MDQTFKKHARNLLIYSSVIGFLNLISTHLFPEQYFTRVWPLVLVFFLMANLVGLYFLFRAFQSKFASFMNRFLTITFLKMMVYILVILSHVYFNREDALRFTVLFIVYYILYTFFEVNVLLKINRTSTPK